VGGGGTNGDDEDDATVASSVGSHKPGKQLAPRSLPLRLLASGRLVGHAGPVGLLISHSLGAHGAVAATATAAPSAPAALAATAAAATAATAEVAEAARAAEAALVSVGRDMRCLVWSLPADLAAEGAGAAVMGAAADADAPQKKELVRREQAQASGLVAGRGLALAGASAFALGRHERLATCNVVRV